MERRPDLLPQERVGQVRQSLEREGERLRVQPHQRVVVVAQVRVDEERRGTPDGLRDGQLLAADADRDGIDGQLGTRRRLPDQIRASWRAGA